jgi:hypothetical protein
MVSILSQPLFLRAHTCTGIEKLFTALIRAIISRRDAIERENELKKRDSVLLSASGNGQTWSAEEEDEREEEVARGWCCSS